MIFLNNSPKNFTSFAFNLLIKISSYQILLAENFITKIIRSYLNRNNKSVICSANDSKDIYMLVKPTNINSL